MGGGIVMLKDCSTFQEYEKTLKTYVQGVSFIGQVPLSEDDVDALNNFILLCFSEGFEVINTV